MKQKIAVMSAIVLAASYCSLSATASGPSDSSTALVRVGRRAAFFLKGSSGGISAQERADYVSSVIDRVLINPALDPSRIEARVFPDGKATVMLDKLLIIAPTLEDAVASDTTREVLARTWAQTLREEATELKPLFMRKVSVRRLRESHILILIIQIAALLLAARVCGEIALRLRQPPVIGQLLAGVLLGQSILGAIVPGVRADLFPADVMQSHLLEVVSWLGVIFLLVLAGMRADLELIRQQLRPTIWTSVTGLVIPFCCGFVIGWLVPESLLVNPGQRILLSFFLGAAMSISAVPIIAKILMELNLLRRNIGQVILSSALAHDVVAWILLSAVVGQARRSTVDLSALTRALVGTIGFTAFSLTIGRRLTLLLLRWVNEHVRAEEAVLTIAVVLVLIGSAITQYIGVNVILGAFVMGVLLSGSPLANARVMRPIESMTMGIFAPIFFAATGMYVDVGILADSHSLLTLIVFIVTACVANIFAGYLGSRKGGLSRWDAVSVGLGMNARGATGIIVAIVGLSMGILSVALFSIMIAMALVTTAMTPPLLRWALSHVPPEGDELARLEREKSQESGFVSRIHRVLLPSYDGHDHNLAAQILRAMAQQQPMEITGLLLAQSDEGGAKPLDAVNRAITDGKATMIIRTPRKPLAPESVVCEGCRDHDLLVLSGLNGNRLWKSNVVAQCPCALLLVQEAVQSNIGQPHEILVPSTGAAHCAHAAELASVIALACGARITALHVIEEEDRILAGFAQESDHTQVASEIVSAVGALAGPLGVDVRPIVTDAKYAGPAIVQTAESIGAHLIVLGGSARATHRLFLGNTVSYVLDHAQCSVAVLKP